MANPFASARLIYRAVETPDDDELFLQLNQDPSVFQNSNPSLLRPQARVNAMGHQKALMERSLIGVVICLAPTSTTPTAKPTAIGQIHIDSNPSWAHHRQGEIGITLLREYQGQGYGTEAIRWILDSAFKAAGLHRVVIRSLGWNLGAKRLYERIGFVLEGTSRDMFWHDGRFWDEYQFSILEGEWKAMKEKEAGGK